MTHSDFSPAFRAVLGAPGNRTESRLRSDAFRDSFRERVRENVRIPARTNVNFLSSLGRSSLNRLPAATKSTTAA